MKQQIEYMMEQCEKQGPFDQINWKRRYCRIGRYWIAANMQVLHYPYYILQAIEEAKQLIQWDPANIYLRLLLIQLFIDGNEFEQAETQLESIQKYKKSLFIEKPETYIIVLYLQCLLSFYIGKSFQVRRSWKKLDKAFPQFSEEPFLLCLYARLLRMIQEEEEKSLDILYKAYEHHCRSPLLYLELNMLFMSKPSLLNDMNPILLQAIHWGMRYGFTTKEVVEKFCFWFLQQPQEQYEWMGNWENKLYHWYKETHSQPILHGLCKLYINHEKIDQQALEIYQKAWEEQIYIDKIDQLYIKAAYWAGEESLPMSLIQSQCMNSILPMEYKAFLYHILIQNKAQYDWLSKEEQEDIIDFTKKCLSQGRTGVYYGTLYQKLMEDQKFSKEDLHFLWDFICLYEIKVLSSDIDTIFIQSSEEATINHIPVYNQKAFISLSDLPSTVLCIGKNGEVCPPEIIITKIISPIPDTILQFYMEQGYDSLAFRILLAKAYMKKSNLSAQEISFLEETVEMNEISKDFCYEMNQWLAIYYAKEKRYEKANQFYSKLPFEQLPIKMRQEGIRTLIYTGEVEKALFWLSTMGIEWVSTQEMMHLIQNCMQQKICSSYVLFLYLWSMNKGIMEEIWMDDLQNYFDGTIDQLLVLREKLLTFDIQDIHIDQLERKIVQQSIWTRQWNSTVEEIFIRIYDQNHPTALDFAFATYCTYQILHEEKLPILGTIHILEELYLNDSNQTLLGYALLYLYGEEKVYSPKRSQVLDRVFPILIKNNIHFPWIQKIQDKTQYLSYIEKNISFLCNSFKNEELWFYYKNQKTKNNQKVPMKYVGMGIYTVMLPVFYGEILHYYIAASKTPSIILKEGTYHSKQLTKVQGKKTSYDVINQGLIYHSLFQFEEVEKYIELGFSFYQQEKKGILL